MRVKTGDLCSHEDMLAHRVFIGQAVKIGGLEMVESYTASVGTKGKKVAHLPSLIGSRLDSQSHCGKQSKRRGGRPNERYPASMRLSMLASSHSNTEDCVVPSLWMIRSTE